MLNCAASYQAIGSYDDILATGVPDVAKDPYFPRALAALASNRIWNGVRPRQWTRIAAAVIRRPTLRGLMLLGFATWADISPTSLRSALSQLIAWRSRRARAAWGDRPVLWRPGVAPSPLVCAESVDLTGESPV
jgi:hypothetical protein